MSEGETKPEVASEQQKFFKDHDFYVFHGNFQFEMPVWVNQFGDKLVDRGSQGSGPHTSP